MTFFSKTRVESRNAHAILLTYDAFRLLACKSVAAINGLGKEKADEKVFVLFKSIERKETRSLENTGIGLAPFQPSMPLQR